MHLSAAATPSPGSLWRAALGTLRSTLEQRGVAPLLAEELGETVIIVCALQHDPADLQDAVETVMHEASRQHLLG